MRVMGISIGELLVIIVVIVAIGGGIFLYRKQLQKKAGSASPAVANTPQFCPKCGNSIASGSLECSNCGNKIADTSTSSFSIGSLGTTQLPKLGMAAIICAAISIVITLFPWFSTGSVASYTQSASAFFGGAGSSYVFESSYWPWNAFSLAQTLGNYYSLAGNRTAAGNLALFGPLCTLALIVAVVLLAYGAFMAYKKGKMLALRIGGICMLVAACCFVIIGAVGNDIGNMTPFPVFSVLLSLAVTILSFAVPSKK